MEDGRGEEGAAWVGVEKYVVGGGDLGLRGDG